MFGARITSRLNAARSQVSRNQKRNFFGLPEEGVRGEAYAKFEADKEAHAAKTAVVWKNFFLFTGIPVLALATVNTIKIEQEHSHHTHEHPYHYKNLPYLHIHVKNFPWKDGKKSLFYNPEVQPME